MIIGGCRQLAAALRSPLRNFFNRRTYRACWTCLPKTKNLTDPCLPLLYAKMRRWTLMAAIALAASGKSCFSLHFATPFTAFQSQKKEKKKNNETYAYFTYIKHNYSKDRIFSLLIFQNSISFPFDEKKKTISFIKTMDLFLNIFFVKFFSQT